MADSTTTALAGAHTPRSRPNQLHAQAPVQVLPAWAVAVLALALALVAVLLAGAAPARAAGIAPPATAPVQSACVAQQVTDAKTADVARRVSGRIGLGGCVTDGGSGIAHILLEWHAGGDADDARADHGRICTDASIAADGAWSCSWNTATLPPGEYVVRFVAVDEVGNAGHFDRRYEVVDAPRADTTPPTGSIAPGDTAAAPGSDTAGGGTTASGTTGSTGAAAGADSSSTSGGTAGAATTDTDSTAPGATSDGGSSSGPDPADAATSGSASGASGAASAAGDAPESNGAGADPATDTASAIDGPDLVQQLALARLAACDRGEVADAPTDDPTVVSQVDQADAVRACIAPALLSLGATDVALDALPVPPAVRITFAHRADLAPLLAQLPVSVAGVPMEYVAADDPPPSAPAAAVPADAATPSISTDVGG